MSIRRNLSRLKPLGSDLEEGLSQFPERSPPSNGDPKERGNRSTDEVPGPEAGEQSTGDDSDDNDKFWKLFQEEAAAEAKWQVGIWKTELDSLLVFAGLFAAVVSAFLIDLRLHLRPDPQLIALNQIVSILNNTGPIEFDKPPLAVRAVGFLWYGSLVVTLIGALCGVLAKGWLGELLREPPNNPADRALYRWRRDIAAKKWHMDPVITSVPLLTQIGLAMFFSGFVVQSFGDNHVIGLEVLAYVLLGAFAYAVFTILPWCHPQCPYRTPLSRIFHLIPTIPQNKDTHATKTESKIDILMARLNPSSNDEIFCSAAAMLDAKLESSDSDKWYKGVEKQASGIAEALSVRLKSFAHRVQQFADAPSLSILKDTASAGIKGQALAGHFYLPIEQGIACLRVLLKSMEASISSESDKSDSPWIEQDMDRQWRLSNIFTEPWRLLALSVHITKLVAKEVDYDTDDIAESDWENMIRATFSDLTLRAISGASACRGLLHGKENLQRLCALGLAMFIEVEATSSSDTPKQIFIEKDSDPAVDAGKVITEKLWKELVKIWKNMVVQLLQNAHSEGEEDNSFMKLLDQKLYQNDDVKSSVSETILEQLSEAWNWTTRKQAVQMLTQLAENDLFREAVVTNEAIVKVVGLLQDDDEDVRAATIRALSTFIDRYPDDFSHIMETEGGITKLIAAVTDDESSNVRSAAVEALLKFSKKKFYQFEIKSSIPSLIEQLNNSNWRIREDTVKTLVKLGELDVFEDIEGLFPELIARLEDDDSDVQTAAVAAVIALSTRTCLRQSDIKSSIPTIIKQLENEDWRVRQQAIQVMVKLFESDMFRENMNDNGAIPKIVDTLEDRDPGVRNAANEAIQVFSASNDDLYYSGIKSSVPIMIKRLDNESWRTQQVIRTLMILSDNVIFQETIQTHGVINKLISKLGDSDEDIRVEAINALVILAVQDYFSKAINSGNAISSLIDRLSDSDDSVCFAAVKAISTLSTYDTYKNKIKSLVSISSFVKQLQNESWNVRQQAIEILEQFAINDSFQAAMNNEKIVPKLTNILANDCDEDVRTAAAEAMAVFGAQEPFQKALKSEQIILKLIEQLSDPYSKVRSAAQSTLLTLCQKEPFQKDIKSSIPTIMKKIKDKHWGSRQQGILMLTKLSDYPLFQEAMKTEMAVAKITDKLIEDEDEYVRAAAARALSALGTKDPFQERMKSEKVISKLITKLVDDNDGGVRSAVYDALLELGKHGDEAGFLQTVISTLQTIEEPGRMGVYRFLNALKDSLGDTLSNDSIFLKQIDTNICKLLTQMRQKDLSFIFRSITLLSETADQGLKGEDLEAPNASNKLAREVVETVVRSKLVYDKNSPDRNQVILALSRLANHDVFVICMKPAITGLTEATSSIDRDVRSAAIAAISALAKRDEFRADLVPAIQKLTQQLASVWDEDDPEEYPLNIIEAMTALVEYKEFRPKLKSVVPILMEQLPNGLKDVRNDTAVDQDDDKNEIAFYKATCKLISDLCKIQAVGRELVPKLTGVLSNMDASLTEELLQLVTTLINYGHLTMNDRIALASSLRITSSVEVASEVQVCKLIMAALLNEAHEIEHPSSDYSDYSFFLGAVLGNGNETVKSKLYTLMPLALQTVYKSDPDT